MIILDELKPEATATIDSDGLMQEWEREDACAICGELFTEEEWGERHTSGDGEDCHANCCDVCAHDDEGYNFVDGRVRRDEEWESKYGL